MHRTRHSRRKRRKEKEKEGEREREGSERKDQQKIQTILPLKDKLKGQLSLHYL